MAHPSDYLGKAGVVVIDVNSGAFTAPDNRYIVAIQNMAAARDVSDDTFTVKGEGIYEYLGANDSDGTQHYTSAGALLNPTHDAGFYEAVNTTSVAMEITVGAIVYGKFTSVDATDGDKAILYLGGIRGRGQS